ncbi:MAG: hypothetical protein WA688_07640 [Thermoplasmata archaeon]
MSERRFGRRGLRIGTFSAVLAAGLLLALPGLVLPAAAAYPVLPDVYWSPILGALSGPTLTPGGSGSVTFRVGNPLVDELVGTTVHLQVYAYNPTDGGAVQTPPAGSTPTFGMGSPEVTISAPLLLPAGTSWNWSVPVTVPTTAPLGDYAVRFAVNFSMANVSYLMESRGFFSASAWASATQYPNGTPTINASQLGVSGVIPETSILVSPSSTPVVLYAVLGVGLGLAALGAYWWARSETKSKSGARRPSPPQSAPTAFGSRRRSEGD